MGLFDRIKQTLSGGRLDVRARFDLQREAISGTMSKFYIARDRTTGRTVGLKILDKEKTAAVEARFKGLNKPSEGEISSRFDHPYIVKTYEYGLTTDGSQYLVMELLGGPGMNFMLSTADARLEGNRLKFIRQAAEALATVHKAGFIHRDICPRNLIFTTDCQTLKLTDFGLTIPATPPFLQPGNRTGTPNYLAPEIARRFPTDHRVDVFAFGVTAYQILAGILPWESGATGIAAMTHDQPPADIRKQRPTIDEELAKLQQKTGVKLLWGTANLFTHPRYVHGAATSCNADVFAFAAAQVLVPFRQRHRISQGHAPRDNADLMHRVAVWKMVHDDGMARLMGDHRSQTRLVLGVLQEAGEDAHLAARQAEGVSLLIVDQDGKLPAVIRAVGRGGDAAARPKHQIVDRGVAAGAILTP